MSAPASAPVADSALADSTARPNVVIRTRDLTLAYGKNRAVDRLNMEVREGEIYGFLGRNGAGKTSTIRMLMGVIRADSGVIELLDTQGNRIGIRQKQRIGYVSQEQNFYPWMTCRGIGRFVSGFYPTWDTSEFSRLLMLLDLPPDRKVSHLSGGMRVKLALALALAHRPPILILDEPTSGLDPVARREFLEIIRRQSRAHRRTTFFSSHLIDEVERVADRVGIIHRGQLRYEGDIPRLQASVRKVRYVPHDSASPATASPLAVTQSPRAYVPQPIEPYLVENVHFEAQPVDGQIFEAELCEPVPANEPSRGPTAGPESSEQMKEGTETTLPHPSSPFPLHTRQALARSAVEHGFAVLRDGFDDEPALILAAAPERWAGAPFSPEDVRPLSLEDIFIAMAAEGTPQL